MANTNKHEADMADKKRSGNGNVVTLNEGNKLPMHIIEQWRTKVFSAIADRLCDPNLPIIQRAIGMWKWHTGISLPDRKNVAILGESAMRMQVNVGSKNETIDFGIWLYLNEIRIGVRIPKDILSRGENLTSIIQHCFDDQSCDITKSEKDSNFFDWVFRERGIADKEVMIRSLEDPVLAAMLADGIANVLTHIYMAVINALISENVMALSTDAGLIDADNKQMVLEVSSESDDSRDRVTNALTGIGIHINNVYPQSHTTNFYLITVDSRKNQAEIEIAIANVLASLQCEHSLREVIEI